MAGFSDLIVDLDDAVMDTLNDGAADYLSRTGEVLAEGLPVIVELGVQRSDRLDAVELVRTHEVQKRLLQPFDRKGAFRMEGQTWHIDGIHGDDGHLITFYVVPE
ncbi:hypothetical protein M2318_005318 [Metapseudomonas resinovorans]|uniref:hypothetical protein n=1 Tax=Metapseudomonas resinovorans TaxID=53412 RepID=UPI003D2084E7